MSDRPETSVIPLADAYHVFQALEIDVSSMSRADFKRTYYRLALKHQNRASSHDLMAQLNLARASILKLHRWTEADARAAEPPRAKRTFSAPHPRIEQVAPAPSAHLSSEDEYRKTRALLDRIVERHRTAKPSIRERLLRKLRRMLSREPPTT